MLSLSPTTYCKGLLAEFAACAALRLKGYRILAERYRSKWGEIDIIAVRGGAVIFVEVKTRATKEEANESISRRQQERVIRASRDFLTHHPSYTDYDLRFDAIVISSWHWPTHIENAWNP